MTDLLKELKTLNSTLQRLSDFLLPALDQDIFGSYKAFRAYTRNNNLSIKGVAEHDLIRLKELRGIDDIIRRLKKNTEQFLNGLPCNNVLLYGPRGTGKPSTVKAILNAYAGRGLKMIEMFRDTLFHILEITEDITERPERFIIFCNYASLRKIPIKHEALKRKVMQWSLSHGVILEELPVSLLMILKEIWETRNSCQL